MMPILAMLILMTTSLLASAEPIRVRLAPSASISAGAVRLGDIATLSGGDASRRQQLEGVIVLHAASGPSLDGETISAEQIRQQIRRSGFLPSEVEYAGSLETELFVAPADKGVTSESGQVPSKARSSSRRTLDQWEAEVLRLLRAHLAQSTAWPQSKLRVQLMNKQTLAVLEKLQPEHFDLVAPTRWNLGNQRVMLELREENLSADYVLQVRLELERPVVVARRQILRNSPIGIDDVEVVSTVIAADDSQLASDPAEVVGKLAQRVVDVDQAILLDSIKSPPLVFRSAPVTVRVIYGTAMVEITAIAKEEGGHGDWIEVYNPITRKPLESKVQVVGFQQAVLPPQAPPSKAATAYRPTAIAR